MNLQEKATEILFSNVNKNDIYESNVWHTDIVEAMIEFAKQMCDLQKEKCANTGYYKTLKEGEVIELWEITNINEILNCENVCEI